MVFKLIKLAIFFIIFPMMAIPFLYVKIPPIYQIVFTLLLPIAFFKIFKTKKLKKEIFYKLCACVVFVWYLFFIGSQITQVCSILFYILIILFIRYNYSFLIFSNEDKICKMLLLVYIITLVICGFQVFYYYFFGGVKLIPDFVYLTSGIYSQVLNNPVSGWNESFRPNAFYAEPSFLGFFLCMYMSFNF
ncbi:hypothetical protein ACFSJQ_13785 [Vibrio olivae]